VKELMFFRCTTCSRVVSPWDVEKGGCQFCNCNRIMPTNLTLWEKVVQVVKNPRIWEWNNVVQTYEPGQEEIQEDAGGDSDALRDLQ
jgi:hypothetical protein